MSEKNDTGCDSDNNLLPAYLKIVKRWEHGYPLGQLFSMPRRSNTLFNGVMTLFRRLSQVDFVIDDLAFGKVRPRVRWILRWAVTHFLFLQNPPFPVVANACVTFTRTHFHKREAAFVNAVCRKLSRSQPAVYRHWLQQNAPLPVLCSLPESLCRRWEQRFGKAQLTNLTHTLLQPAPVFVRLRAPLLPTLARAKGALEPVPAPPWAPAVTLCKCLQPHKFFAEFAADCGTFYAQDPSTLLAPELLAIEGHENIADLCAAPGGKAAYLSDRLGPHGTLVCADRSAKRLNTVKQHIRAATRCSFTVADAAAPPFAADSFDKILLDVPCTNTGVIQRRPDVRWRFSEQHLRELSQLQKEILRGTAPLLKPGGLLVYSTCSLEKEENEDQVTSFLEEHPEFSKLKEVTLLPGMLNDGAYAALLKKVNPVSVTQFS